MHAEFQVLSPLVPLRQVRFLRFCKQHGEGTWAVVDVSVGMIQDGSDPHGFANCRRLPSGCVLQDMPNGSSKVLPILNIYHTSLSSNAIVLGFLRMSCSCLIGTIYVRGIEQDH